MLYTTVFLESHPQLITRGKEIHWRKIWNLLLLPAEVMILRIQFAKTPKTKIVELNCCSAFGPQDVLEFKREAPLVTTAHKLWWTSYKRKQRLNRRRVWVTTKTQWLSAQAPLQHRIVLWSKTESYNKFKRWISSSKHSHWDAKRFFFAFLVGVTLKKVRKARLWDGVSINRMPSVYRKPLNARNYKNNSTRRQRSLNTR